MSVLESCGPDNDSPAMYMEMEIERETKVRVMGKKHKIDIMGTAIRYAMHDI